MDVRKSGSYIKEIIFSFLYPFRASEACSFRTNTTCTLQHFSSYATVTSATTLLCLFLILSSSIYPGKLFANEELEPLSSTVTSATNTTEIYSKELEQKEGVYYLKGDIRILRSKEDETVLVLADEAMYNPETGDAELLGNIFYENNSVTIKAKRANLNLSKKTGILYDAEITFKKDFMRLISPEVQKLSEDHFIFKKATFTTCEGIVPDWCIAGRDIDLIRGDRLSGKDVFFKIKGIPVFYTPYIWAPALTERKTGLLIPSFGYSNRLGFQYTQSLYIVLGEHADSTLIMDLYPERGLGKGLELRLRGLPENRVDLWAYHIRDERAHEDFHEILLRENWTNASAFPQSQAELTGQPTATVTSTTDTIFSSTGWSGSDDKFLRQFISIHTAHKDFFSVYNPLHETRLTRFLSSSTEISYMKGPLRLFLDAEYWQDLKADTSRVAQKLPEAGITIYPSSYGNFYYSLEAKISNFYREDSLRGQRLWLAPSLNYSTGDTVVLTQTLNLKTAHYWLEDPSETISEDQKTLSEIGYSINLMTALSKRYDNFTHIIEPVLRYTRTEKTGFNGEDSGSFPLKEPFDIRDLFQRSSSIEMGVLNRFEFTKSQTFQIRLSQAYETLQSRWLPFTGELALRGKGLSGAMEIEYDHDNRELTTATLKTGLNLKRANLSNALRFSKDLDILFLNSSADYQVTDSLSMNSTIWYDLKGGGLRNFLTGISWKRRCWTLNLRYIKTPEDYSVRASIDLSGF